jgi:glycosyltransferase involved in cell wall biosynthesis
MSSAAPQISVLVRTAGRPSFFLRRALASIGTQSVRPDEIVIVNVGEARLEVDSAIRDAAPTGIKISVEHAPSLGRAAALNRAANLARADWLAFLDDDDTWSPSFLASTGAAIARRSAHSTFGGVVTQTCAIYERYTGRSAREVGREAFNPGLIAIDLAALAVENRFTNNALVLRRAVLDAVGPWREDLVALEDWEFNLRVTARFHLEVISEMLAHYHRRPPNDLAPNTSTVELDRTAIELRNEWLRADLAAGRIGLGQLALGGESLGLGRALSRTERWRSKIAGWVGRSSR